ncbi:MAG: methyltransferase domain-containing protein [Candidatus Bathyarchaeota archaeon]|nr:methyltransferase domain-containing protein [Candidatus Bathyarchaeota archaeon]MDH5788270.1 methyltransferase domain-containing protein [Candidatus Bathyarchaeota archaeon]
MSTKLERYIKDLQLKQFFKRLGASNPEILAKEVEHFTTKEAKKRDKIVVSYFGRTGVNRIVNNVTKLLLAPPRLLAGANVLDIGAGTGFLTVKIAKKISAKLPEVSFYAMDLTPAMLFSLEKKNADVVPFVGIAENIEGSIKEARKHFPIPYKFDAVFSTLMLHHSTHPEKVFKSIKATLKKNGKAILIDMCEHTFEEFKMEMGDVHLGFKPENIREMARQHFSEVKVEKIPGICCKSSGRSAEIFVASMRNDS